MVRVAGSVDAGCFRASDAGRRSACAALPLPHEGNALRGYPVFYAHDVVFPGGKRLRVAHVLEELPEHLSEMGFVADPVFVRYEEPAMGGSLQLEAWIRLLETPKASFERMPRFAPNPRRTITDPQCRAMVSPTILVYLDACTRAPEASMMSVSLSFFPGGI